MTAAARHRTFAIAATSALCFCLPQLRGANLTFDPSKTGTGSSGGGAWDLTTTDWSTGTADQAWTQTSATVGSNAAIFAGGTDGATDAYAVTLGTALAATTLTFNNSGYDLTATSAQTLSMTNVGSGVVTVAAGKTASVGANVTVNFNTASNTGERIGLGTGTVFNIESGAIFTRSGTSTSGFNPTSASFGFGGGTTTAAAATYTINVAGTLSYNVAAPGAFGAMVFANTAGDVATVNVNSGGVISSNSTTGGVVVANNASTGVLTVNTGGTVSTTGTAGVFAGIDLTATNGTGTVNLNGGAISTYEINNNFTTSAGVATTGGTGTFNFNGGTLTGIATNTTFITGLSAANVLAGGANINTGSFTLTVGQALVASTTSTGGGLTVNGSGTNTGTLILTGANTYTGATTISAGTLQLGSAGTTGTLATSSNIVDNGTFAISRTNAVAQGTDFGGVISGTGALVVTGGTLSLGSANTYGGPTSVNGGSVTTVSSLNHFASGSIGGGATTTAPAAGSSLGVPSSAANNVVNLGGGGLSGTLVYVGSGEVTDKTINLGGGSGTPNGIVDQSGTGALVFTGNVTAAIVGKTLTLQGSTAGTGQIAGIIGSTGGTLISLTKAGTGTWTLSSANAYTGGTTVSGGILTITANGALGSGNATVATTATSLTLGTGVTTPFNGSASILTLAGGGTAGVADVGFLNLSSGTNITVSGLVLGTTTEPAGTYNAANSPDYILGPGSVTVVPEPSTWVMMLGGLAGVVGWTVRRRRSA